MSLPEALNRIPPFAARFRPAGIAGVGSALPGRVVSNDDVAPGIGVDAAWIERRTGIRQRRQATGDTTVAGLATAAAQEALRVAEVPPQLVDLVLVATLAADDLMPNAAPLVAHALGATGAGAVDVGAACTGFLGALSLGASAIEAGRAERVLVIGAEILSRFTDPHDKRTAGLFGDGAGAVLLAAGDYGRVGPVVLGCDGAAAPFIRAGHDDRLIRMDGHETFKRAVGALVGATNEALALADLAPGDVDLFVYHQANGRILSSVAEHLGVTDGRVLDVIAQTGNTSAASIPLALAQASRTGQLGPGARVLLGAVGAGFTWGATVVEWAGA